MKNETLEFIIDVIKRIALTTVTAAKCAYYLFMPTLVVLGITALFLHFLS